ncbi:hypothetical protein K402DRAFT_321252 [Aulographum hederae CBS 113979]|uniref:Uncharacterized protein n=1 Tax=Aulographum hederae CBS 113979 TaxID=1176131 RepID=A0A6G1HH98_9PEZI|nr:hypothetical protein K402DRAFT_321252 [Aulographum hederae CBS 113979]
MWATGALAQFNNPPGVDIWCGKAYRATNASFAPGGGLVKPIGSSEPLLDMRVRPRMNIYTSNDDEASFIVDARISFLHGQTIHSDITFTLGDNRRKTDSELSVDIFMAGSTEKLISGAKVTMNTTSNEFKFPLQGITSSTEPYAITLLARSSSANDSFTATTLLTRLPARSDSGSITKLDSLHGGLLVQDYKSADPAAWTPIFPYSFYVSWDGFMRNAIANVTAFKDLGYNIVHVVPDAALPNKSFNVTEFEAFMDACDEVGLWVMYDMRWSYQNTTLVDEQVNRLKTRKSILLWYTGDEPDGNSDPVTAPRQAYQQIKQLDPYHPISLCLNCENFHYADYTTGADIILSDPYPVNINATYSTVWNTPCNATYGDCGCDNCLGDLADTSRRLDTFARYDEWLGDRGRKLAHWAVPQAFGEETYWPREPTGEEEVVMTMLFLNHGGKGVVMWTFPTGEDLVDTTSRLAKVLTSREVTAMLTGANPTRIDGGGLDVAVWEAGGKMLVSVVNSGYEASTEKVRVRLPEGVVEMENVLWGETGWVLEGDTLVKEGVRPLGVSLLMLGGGNLTSFRLQGFIGKEAGER